MSGEAAVTNGERPGTSGDASVTSGRRGLAIAAAFAALTVYAALQLYANVGTIIAEAERDGSPVTAWVVWALEGTSLVGWLVVLAILWRALAHLIPPRRGWPAALVLLAIGAIVASAVHVAVMVLLREAVWAANGLDYSFPNGVDGWPYELRKDIPDYILFVLITFALQWYLGRPTGTPEPAAATFTAIDGARRVVLPHDEIDRIEAAGNYVEIHAGGRTVLHRSTMQAIEDELGAARFARIHRSRIVRRSAVRQVETLSSGDFEVTLADASVLRGSRRYRERLD